MAFCFHKDIAHSISRAQCPSRGPWSTKVPCKINETCNTLAPNYLLVSERISWNSDNLEKMNATRIMIEHHVVVDADIFT